MSMKKKPSIDDFLQGSPAQERPQTVKPETPPAPPQEDRKQKLARLPVSLLMALKRKTLERSEQTGKRVSEEDLIEEALREFLDK